MAVPARCKIPGQGYPGIFLEIQEYPGKHEILGEFVGAAGSNAGEGRKRIRASSDKAALHLAHALGESVAGGNPGSTYAFSHPACITSRCPYKLAYFA